MLSKLVRVLKRLLLAGADSFYLASIVTKDGALHEIIGDNNWACSFYSKQLELIASAVFAVNTALPCCNTALNRIHPVSLAEYNAFLILDNMGFEFYSADEVCDVEENFYALNFPKSHPSLDSEDSFYILSKGKASLLRTHTTASLAKALGNSSGEFRKFTIGKVYRNDNSPKHLPFFTQIEGIVCERGANLANVVDLIKRIVCEFLESTPYFRIRRACFPFTEPSLEIDLCRSKRFSSSKCDYNWLEVVGLGLITQTVLANLRACARNVYAFGLGLERLIMLKLGVNNIKRLYNSLEL
ncbi:MAG: hypothetical protein AAI946_00195 [Candidatus Hodgkinia cicadicola]